MTSLSEVFFINHIDNIEAALHVLIFLKAGSYSLPERDGPNEGM